MTDWHAGDGLGSEGLTLSPHKPLQFGQLGHF